MPLLMITWEVRGIGDTLRECGRKKWGLRRGDRVEKENGKAVSEKTTE